MTKISPKHLAEFQELYKEHFWVELDEEKTQEYAEELVSFVKMLLLPNRETLWGK